MNKIITSIDLFYPKVDDNDNILTNTPDYDNTIFKAEFSNYGPYCPLALNDEFFLLKGYPTNEV